MAGQSRAVPVRKSLPDAGAVTVMDIHIPEMRAGKEDEIIRAMKMVMRSGNTYAIDMTIRLIGGVP